MFGLLRIFQMVEANLDVVGPENILGKQFIEGIGGQ
jgi:hypothetical protein